MKKFLTILDGVSIAASTVVLSLPTQAQTFPPAAPKDCIYLKEITTRRPIIRKVVARNNTNANTDFAVPTGRSFSSYIGMFLPENNDRYRVEANLKYNDGTSSTVVKRDIQARRFFVYQQPFRTPTGVQPFQINARITGNANTAYQVAVLACP